MNLLSLHCKSTFKILVGKRRHPKDFDLFKVARHTNVLSERSIKYHFENMILQIKDRYKLLIILLLFGFSLIEIKQVPTFTL